MISIRKFVAYAGAAAGIAAGMALALSTQTALAAAQQTPLAAASVTTHATQATPSAACTAAGQALKTWVANDRSEDAAERAVAKTNPAPAADLTEDKAERATVKQLWSAVRTACAPATVKPTFTRSAQCTAAMQALKAAWTQGRPTTKAQWTQLMSLMQNVRTACGWRDLDRR